MRTAIIAILTLRYYFSGERVAMHTICGGSSQDGGADNLVLLL